jgi:hypothetical protein
MRELLVQADVVRLQNKTPTSFCNPFWNEKCFTQSTGVSSHSPARCGKINQAALSGQRQKCLMKIPRSRSAVREILAVETSHERRVRVRMDFAVLRESFDELPQSGKTTVNPCCYEGSGFCGGAISVV